MNLLKDSPLLEDGSEDRRDSLGFSAYASTLTEAILGTEGPFAIAIYGEWGSGKTSLMRMIKNELDQRHKQCTLSVWFNAWQFEGEVHPVVPLVRCVAESAASAAPSNRSFKRALRRLSAALRGVLRGVKFKVEGGPPLAKVGLEFDAEKALKAEEEIARAGEEEEQGGLAYESIFAAVYSALEQFRLPPGKRIVVFLDDIDRCLPIKAIHLLESLKLVFGQKGYIFVLGMAPEVIEGFLNYLYRDQYKMANFDGRTYLDKVIQMQFQIPPHGPRMDGFTKSLVEKQPELDSLVEIAQLSGRSNPRSTIRFINGVLVDGSINANIAQRDGHVKTELLYFAVSRAIQSRWSTVYDLLRLSPALCEKVAGWTRNSLPGHATAVATGTGDKQEEEIARAMMAHPDLAALLLLPQGKQWLKEKVSREAAASFLVEMARDHPSEDPAKAKLFDAFFSYRITDKEYVGRIAKLLSQEGLRVAWDAALTAGVNWRKALDYSLRRSRALLYFYGPGTPGSDWQDRETEIGIEMAGEDPYFRLIPILLPGADMTHFPSALKEFYWVDLQKASRDASDEQLAAEISELILVLKRS